MSDTLHKYLSTFYCSGRYKLAIKALSSSGMLLERPIRTLPVLFFTRIRGKEEKDCHDLKKNGHCHETPSVLTYLDLGSLVPI